MRLRSTAALTLIAALTLGILTAPSARANEADRNEQLLLAFLSDFREPLLLMQDDGRWELRHHHRHDRIHSFRHQHLPHPFLADGGLLGHGLLATLPDWAIDRDTLAQLVSGQGFGSAQPLVQALGLRDNETLVLHRHHLHVSFRRQHRPHNLTRLSWLDSRAWPWQQSRSVEQIHRDHFAALDTVLTVGRFGRFSVRVDSLDLIPRL